MIHFQNKETNTKYNNIYQLEEKYSKYGNILSYVLFIFAASSALFVAHGPQRSLLRLFKQWLYWDNEQGHTLTWTVHYSLRSIAIYDTLPSIDIRTIGCLKNRKIQS